MATRYNKNQYDKFVKNWYLDIINWLLISFLSSVLLVFLTFLTSIFFELALLSCICFIFLFAYVVLDRHLKIKEMGLDNYNVKRYAEQAVTQMLLSTMTVNHRKDANYIEVSTVTAVVKLPSRVELKIEKLANMSDIEKLSDNVNTCLRDRLANFAVTTAIETEDGQYFQFILEDVGTDKTFVPKNLEDLNTGSYKVKLQENLVIDMRDRPHIAVWGRTGSKKTTVVLSMVLQLFRADADVRFVDGKDEYSAFKKFYPVEKIVNDTNDILLMLDDVLEIIAERQTIMSDETIKRNKMSLRASDVNLQHVVVVADEIGSVIALMDNKQKKQFINALIAIIQRGRSVGVSLIIATQDPSTDVLPQSIRNQFSTKILLGSANSEIQRMAFGQSATSGNVEDFRGYYICDGLTLQPQKFYVPDLHKYHFNELEAFEKAYVERDK